jgi:hypothetical protein
LPCRSRRPDPETHIQTTKQTVRAVTFTGRATQTLTAIKLNGFGSFTIKITTTNENTHTNRGTQTTKTTLNLSIVSGSAARLVITPGPIVLPPILVGTLGTTATNQFIAQSVAAGEGAQAGLPVPASFADDLFRAKETALLQPSMSGDETEGNPSANADVLFESFGSLFSR